MKAICFENKCNNSNFTVGKVYELSNNGIRTNWGGIFVLFENYNKPKSFKIGSVFDFGLCKFKIV